MGFFVLDDPVIIFLPNFLHSQINIFVILLIKIVRNIFAAFREPKFDFDALFLFSRRDRGPRPFEK